MARQQTPSQISEKWQRRTVAAVPDMVAGINAVTESPTSKAADKLDKALANYTDAVQSGRMGRRLRSVSLETWKATTAAKSQARVATGVQAAGQKMTEFVTEFQPHYQAVQAQVNSMPDLTFEDALLRMRANAEGLHKFRRGGSRG